MLSSGQSTGHLHGEEWSTKGMRLMGAVRVRELVQSFRVAFLSGQGRKQKTRSKSAPRLLLNGTRLGECAFATRPSAHQVPRITSQLLDTRQG